MTRIKTVVIIRIILKAGEEMTTNAKRILEIINTSGDHLTAEQIYLKLKADSSSAVLATVYNNLNLLHSQGLIRKVAVAGYPDRYDRIVKHDHLVCKKCGRLSDITLEDLTARLQAQIDGEIFSYDLKVSYLCPQCRREGGRG